MLQKRTNIRMLQHLFMPYFSYKVSVVYVSIRVLRHLKEELAWAIDKCGNALKLQVISKLKQSYH